MRIATHTGWISHSSAVSILLALMVVLCAALPVHAADDEDPNKLFESVYGDAYKAALATTDKTDDIDLANQLRDAVTKFELPTSLIVVIGDRVCTLAERAPEAHLAAVATIDKVIEKDPTKKAFANKRLMAVLTKAYALGRAGDTKLRDSAGRILLDRLLADIDERTAQKKPVPPDMLDEAIRVARVIDPKQVTDLEARRDQAKASSQMAQLIDGLEKKLEANPNDVETRKKLIDIHLVQRDAPDAAIWFNGPGLDDTTRAMLPLAAKDGVGATPKQLTDLATWYMQTGDDADKSYKAAMYLRSKKYFDRFLAEYDKNDLLKAKATLSVAKIDGLLKEYQTQAADNTNSNTTNNSNTTDPAPSNTGVGKLTVEIKGDTITEPERVERLFSQYARLLGREYVKAGDDYMPINHINFNRLYPSSKQETVAAVTKRLTKVELVRDGIITRRVTVKPVPAEAQAVAMALPNITPGNYGYVHSAEVTKVLGPEDMLVKEMWLVDYDTIRGTDYKHRVQRDKLYRQQRGFDNKVFRIVGHDTKNVTVGQRIGMTGSRGKPLQLAIIKTEDNPGGDFFNRTRTVAVLADRIQVNRVGEEEFAKLLDKRSLTKTDLVNIVMEARRESFREYVNKSIQRVEAKGARVN